MTAPDHTPLSAEQQIADWRQEITNNEGDHDTGYLAEVLKEAVDEVERLRAALQWIADYSPHWDERMEETMKGKAREALGIAKNIKTR